MSARLKLAGYLARRKPPRNRLPALALIAIARATRTAALGDIERLAGLPADARAEFWRTHFHAEAETMIAAGVAALRRMILARCQLGELSLIEYAAGRPVAVLIGEEAAP